MIKKSFLKIIFVFLIIGLSWWGTLGVDKAWASFIDTETSSGNTFTAATLDFSLSSPGDFSPQVTPIQSSSRTISVVNNGSLGFQYTVQASNFSGDSVLCNALNLDANVDGGVSEYNGALTSFNISSPILFGSLEDWVFTVSLISNDSSLQNKTCQFNFKFKSWQENSDGSWGFVDEEILGNTLGSGDWMPTPASTPNVVINEVYYNGSVEKEWVELYNASSGTVNLDGWQIFDNYSKDDLPNVNLASGQFAVIVPSGSTLTGIAGGALVITLSNSEVGGGLADTADMLVLKDGGGNVVDQMNWGVPSSSWINYNAVLWNPGPSVVSGHSLARKLKGIDTDTVDDWEDLAIPNPGTNPPPTGGEEE